MSFYKQRVFGKTKNISNTQLIDLFKTNTLDYIKIILLFGSRASKTNHFRSDYDFAILTVDDVISPWGNISKAWNDIGDILNLPDCDMDIVDLKDADDLVLNSIQENYFLLKGDNDELQRLFNKNN